MHNTVILTPGGVNPGLGNLQQIESNSMHRQTPLPWNPKHSGQEKNKLEMEQQKAWQGTNSSTGTADDIYRNNLSVYKII